jgi:hypothetical protein
MGGASHLAGDQFAIVAAQLEKYAASGYALTPQLQKFLDLQRAIDSEMAQTAARNPFAPGGLFANFIPPPSLNLKISEGSGKLLENTTNVAAEVERYNRELVKGLPTLKTQAELFAEMDQDISTLTRGLAGAGELLHSHIVSEAAKGLDYFQRIVATIHDLASSLKDISSVFRVLTGSGGGAGLLGTASNGFSLARALGIGGGTASTAAGGAISAADMSALGFGAAPLAGAGAVGGGATAGAVTTTGGGAGLLGALASNPFTWIAAAGIGAFFGIKAHQNATKGNREDFAKMFGFGSLANFNDYLDTLGPEGHAARVFGESQVGKHNKDQEATWEHMAALAVAHAMPHHATGIAFVPQDGPAYLHRGERVVPASQNAAPSGGGDVHNHVTFNINALDGASVKRIMPELAHQFFEHVRRNDLTASGVGALTRLRQFAAPPPMPAPVTP